MAARGRGRKKGKGHVNEGEKVVFAVELAAFFTRSTQGVCCFSSRACHRLGTANLLSTWWNTQFKVEKRQILTDNGGNGQGQRHHSDDDDDHG